jgi:predicted ester cyclase
MYRSAFPDLSFEVQETVTDGEWVAVRWTSTGTHEGELMGIEPTGKKTAVEGIELDRIEDGKIVESRVSWDALGLLQQLGAVPESPAR